MNMKRTSSGSMIAALLLAATFVAAPHAGAQAYPAKQVTLIVPYPPGGGTDFFARTVGQKMAESLGQPVIVDNRPRGRDHHWRAIGGESAGGRLHRAAR
jgi:tripartite-type tricarboxylate transporter receptor subunit TctC